MHTYAIKPILKSDKFKKKSNNISDYGSLRITIK